MFSNQGRNRSIQCITGYNTILQDASLPPPLVVFPKNNACGNHTETKKKIFKRYSEESIAQEKSRIIQYYLPGKITVDEQFKTKNYEQKNIELFFIEKPYAACPIERRNGRNRNERT